MFLNSFRSVVPNETELTTISIQKNVQENELNFSKQTKTLDDNPSDQFNNLDSNCIYGNFFSLI